MGEFAHVQFAQQDCPGFLQVSDHRGVESGNEIGPYLGGVGGADALGVDLVLDPHGDAVERTPVIAAPNLGLGLKGLLTGLLGHDGDV